MDRSSAPDDGAAARRHGALRVALIYACFAAAWILGSDWLLGKLVHDPHLLVEAGAIKGWAFVAVTAVLLYVLVVRLARSPSLDERAAARRSGREQGFARQWPLFALSAAIVGFTLAALRYDYQEEFTHQRAQLEAVADLRAQQVGEWLADRLAQARFARSSVLWASLYKRWRETGDVVARDQLLARLREMRVAFGDLGAAVVDEQGNVVLAEDGVEITTPPALREAARRALASGDVEHTGFHKAAPGSGPILLSAVAPLVASGVPAKVAVVFHLDAQGGLLPRLRGWPVPSRTATSLLVRREGETVVGTSADNPRALSSPDLLAARYLRGEVAFGLASERSREACYQ